LTGAAPDSAPDGAGFRCCNGAMEEHTVEMLQFLRDLAFVCAAAFGIGGGIGALAFGVALLAG
jgi:hypothetical protein